MKPKVNLGDLLRTSDKKKYIFFKAIQQTGHMNCIEFQNFFMTQNHNIIKNFCRRNNEALRKKDKVDNEKKS